MALNSPAQRVLLLVLIITVALIVSLMMLGRQTERWDSGAEGYGWSPLVEHWLWYGREEGRICALAEDTFEEDAFAEEGWWTEVLDHEVRFVPVGLHRGRPNFAPSPFEYAVEFSLDCRLHAPPSWFPGPSQYDSRTIATAFSVDLRQLLSQSRHTAQIEEWDPEPNVRELTYAFGDVISGSLQIDTSLVEADEGQRMVIIQLRLLEASREYVGPRSSPTPAPPTATATPSVTPSPWPEDYRPLPPDLAMTATALYKLLIATPVPNP